MAYRALLLQQFIIIINDFLCVCVCAFITITIETNNMHHNTMLLITLMHKDNKCYFTWKTKHTILVIPIHNEK